MGDKTGVNVCCLIVQLLLLFLWDWILIFMERLEIEAIVNSIVGPSSPAGMLRQMQALDGVCECL